MYYEQVCYTGVANNVLFTDLDWIDFGTRFLITACKLKSSGVMEFVFVEVKCNWVCGDSEF